MGKRKIAKDPLLYIQQPKIKTPEAQMQNHYMSTKPSQETFPEPPPPPKQQEPIKRRTSYFKKELEKGLPPSPPPPAEHPAPAQAAQHAEEPETEKKERPSSGTKKFKDMPLEEKVNYLLHSPKHIPKMKCELKTNEKTFRGIITDYQDDHVFIQAGARSSSKKVPFAEITDIRLLGL